MCNLVVGFFLEPAGLFSVQRVLYTEQALSIFSNVTYGERYQMWFPVSVYRLTALWSWRTILSPPGIRSQQWDLSYCKALRRHSFNLTLSRLEACPGLFLWKFTVLLFVCHHELKSLNPPEVFIFFFVGCGVRSAVSASLRNVKPEN